MAKIPSPRTPIVEPPIVPPAPTVRSQFEFDCLSEEDKARALFTFSNFWLNRSTSASAPRSSGARILIPHPQRGSCEWSPSPEELASLHSDDWKKF